MSKDNFLDSIEATVTLKLTDYKKITKYIEALESISADKDESFKSAIEDLVKEIHTNPFGKLSSTDLYACLNKNGLIMERSGAVTNPTINVVRRK